MRKAIATLSAVAALVLVSAPAAVADDPIQITTFTATPLPVDLPTGADAQVDFTVVTSSGTNTVTDVTVTLPGVVPLSLTSADATNWSGTMTVPSTFKAGTYAAQAVANGGGGETAQVLKNIVVRTQPVITLTRTPTTPRAGGNYVVSGSIKEPNGAGALIGMAGALTLTGPGYHTTFVVSSTGAFHHSVTHALPATWAASYTANSMHLATSASTSLTVSANPTRFVSFDAGPEPAYRGGSIAVHGYLQRYSPTLARWVAYGGQRVTISRVSPSGYATARTTTSTGYFAALLRGANIVETAGWHASFAGWSTGSTVVNGASVSSGDAVAAVTAPLRITRVYYDSPGSDLPVSNTKLNAEYVVITNTGSRTANLYRWWVSDPKGHSYTFGGNIYLSPGRSVVLHTGSGTNGGGHYYWHQGYYVWNNTGDTAYLRSDLNYLVDRCSWGDGPGFTNC